MSKSDKIKDSRFSNFETDPRFRLPSKKKTKTTIDKRFAGLLKDDEFTASAKVDRYGRKIKSDAKKKALQRLYQEEDEDDEAADKIEVEDDDVVKRELESADTKYDPARGGGFSSSESESESEDEEDEEEGGAAVDGQASMQRLRDDEAGAEEGEVTNRIAIVNLDWDHLKSQDLMALFSSFLPTTGGRIDKIAIYPSEFGKERMQREELEGPPKEIFKSSSKGKDNSDSEDDSEDSDSEDSDKEEEEIRQSLVQEDDDRDFDSDKLRSYQLDRLRYYYAIMTCSDKATAKKIYEATDGTEYQSSSNFIDLRFVPDEVEFDDEPRDECEKVPEGYKPIDFITDALQHSKVKLTWDLHPEEAARKENINKAFRGSRNDIEENDLKAYLASDSEDEPEAGIFEGDEEEEDKPKLSKKEEARRKMREALGLGGESSGDKSKGGPVGDMEITFAPALTENKKSKKPSEEEETTIEKYARKERERKESKREAARARREGRDPNAVADASSDEGEPEEDLGFDDPFFAAEAPQSKKSKSAVRKEERLAKRAEREAEEAEKAKERAQLQLIMAEDDAETNGDGETGKHLDHFNMNDINRAEKQKKKKDKFKKKGKKGNGTADDKMGLQEGFKMNVGDDRFKAVFESHEYAIDPSNPKYKATEGMQQLLEETRKKRKAGPSGGDSEAREVKKVKKGGKGGEEDLGSLVASVKRKSGKPKKK